MVPERIGRYEIKSELGRGGMALVYLAHDPRFRRDVALKVLSGQFIENPTFRARFEREAQAIAAIEHPAIVPVYDFGDENGQLYLVMRYMPGGTLSDRLKDGPLSLAETARVMTRLAPALDAVHKHGIIHRDLKPGNILFDPYDNACISDFGIARLTEATTTLTGDAIIGTPSYMSPEQVRGDVTIDGRSDLYAMGAILFEMVSGKPPYEATTPMGIALKQVTEPVPRILDVKADLPPEMQALIDRAMAKDRERRFATAGEMAAALEAISSAAPPKAPTAPPAREAASGEVSQPSLPAQLSEAAFSPATRPAQPRPASQPAPAAGTAPSAPPPLHHPEPPENPTSVGSHPPGRRRSTLPVTGLLALIVIGALLCVAGVLAVSSRSMRALMARQGARPTALVVKRTSKPAVTQPVLAVTPAVIHTAAVTRPTPTLGLETFRDNFMDPNTGWTTGEYSGNQVSYDHGVLRILVEQPRSFLWSTPDLNFADVIIAFNASKASGADENYFGVVCRIQNLQNFYMLAISSNGYYFIGKYKDNNFSLVGMDNWQSSDAIHQGKTTNHIEAGCVGNSLSLTVNNVPLTTVTDSDFASGDMGLMAGALDVGGTNIIFDNFYAHKP